MSVHVISWVLRHSEETLGRRLVLIVLADHASDAGDGAYPSVKTIAEQTRMSERAVQYALRRLVQNCSVAISGTSPFGTTIYRVLMGGANFAGGAIHDRNLHEIAPKPSLTTDGGTTDVSGLREPPRTSNVVDFSENAA